MAPSHRAERRSHRPARTRVGATILSLACLAAGVAACGKSSPEHEPIALLPNASAQGQSWDWTAGCQFTPRAADGCAPAGPVIGAGQLAGDQWNLGAGHASAESVSMAVDSAGGLTVNGNLSSAPPCTASTCLTRQGNTWVRGYPSILYGTDQCHADTSPTPSPQFQLPVRVDAIPADLVGHASYAAQGSQVTYDVAYDMWLSPSSTKTPCQSDGTVEVMVWTDYDAQALLPGSLKVGTTTIPYSVNGAAKSGDQEWSVYANNIYGGGHTVAWGGTIWLVLNNPAKQAAVNVDISAALADVGGLLQHNYGWAPFASTYWLDTIAFGMEYGPQDANPYGSGPAKFSLDLRKYCLQVGTTVPAASC
jgi:Glycosyl hydrolase family 12